MKCKDKLNILVTAVEEVLSEHWDNNWREWSADNPLFISMDEEEAWAILKRAYDKIN